MISTNADFLRQCGDETWKLTDTGRARLRHIAEQHERMEKALRFYAEKDKDPKLSWLQAMATTEPPREVKTIQDRRSEESMTHSPTDADILRSIADYIATDAAGRGKDDPVARLRRIADELEQMEKAVELVRKVSADVDFLRSFADYVAIEAAAEGEQTR